MAEFLVKNYKHWILLASPEKLSTVSLASIESINQSWEIDDIVEVFRDGRLGEHAHAGGKFRIVRDKTVKYEEAKAIYEKSLVGSIVGVDGIPIINKRRRYQMVLPIARDVWDITMTDSLNYIVDKDV